MEVFRLDLNLKLYQPRKVFSGVVGTWWVIVRNYFVFKVLILLLSSLGSRPCPGQLQKTTRCEETLTFVNVSNDIHYILKQDKLDTSYLSLVYL